MFDFMDDIFGELNKSRFGLPNVLGNAFTGKPILATGEAPATVNSQGSKLTQAELDLVAGKVNFNEAISGKIRAPLDASKRAEMFANWLTAGGAPKQVDPGKIFADATAMKGVQDKAAAGMGFNGLFGFGKVIGDLAPKPQDPTQQIQPMQGLNMSPFKSGVPYSVPSLPGVGR
jgi:hypothetical protein